MKTLLRGETQAFHKTRETSPVELLEISVHLIAISPILPEIREFFYNGMHRFFIPLEAS